MKKMLWSLILFAHIFIFYSGSHAFFTPRKKVLIINSYHKGYFWSDNIIKGVDSLLEKHTYIDRYYEYMDTKRINHTQYYHSLEEIYRLKYKQTIFDLILVADDNGFTFCLKNQQTIFKNAPMVFCGINRFRDDVLKGHINVTGVVEMYDPFDTLKAARTIFPSRKHIIAITDNTKSGIIDRRLLETAIEKMQDNGVQFEFWHNYEYQQLKDKIRQVPGDSLVIFTDFTRDKDGKVISNSMLGDILMDCPAPVFGRQEALLNNGLFGGMIVSGFYQGEAMAGIALKILSGTKAELIPVIKKSPNRYMFDYNYLKRFSVSEKDLPQGSIVLNKPASFMDVYHEHRIFLHGIFSVFFLIVIIILSVSIKKVMKSKREREKLIQRLQVRLNQIKTLHGLLPICSNCKKIRDDKGYWKQIEEYISSQSDVEFTHSLCNDCAEKLYGNEKWYRSK